MYNLRYHIASLVAVFLALAIGLVLGTVVVERGMLDRQSTTLVQRLNDQFKSLKQENDDLREDRDRERAFAGDAVGPLTAGMLRGKRVLIVANSGRDDGLSVARDALQAAGAELDIATFKASDLGRQDPKVGSALSAVATQTTPGGAGDPVVQALATEWTKRGAVQPVTQALKEVGQLSVDGTSTSLAPDAVVLLASFDGRADTALVNLVAAVGKSGVPVVGVESQAMETGVAEASLAAGIPTVDDVDRPEGALALVYVTAGKAEGHFGMKAGATEAYPRLVR